MRFIAKRVTGEKEIISIILFDLTEGQVSYLKMY